MTSTWLTTKLRLFGKMLLTFVIALTLVGLVFVAVMAFYHTLLLLISKASSLALVVTPVAIYMAAIRVYTALNPVHSLLSLIVVFFLTAVFMLALGAEFLAYTFLIVYVGAIAILFLFVIILLDIKDLTATQFVRLNPAKSFGTVLTYLFACFILSISLDYSMEFIDRTQLIQLITEPTSAAFLVHYVTQEFRDILIFSNLFYGYYAIIFVLIALLLLTAMLGAIVLATSTSEETKRKINFLLWPYNKKCLGRIAIRPPGFNPVPYSPPPLKMLNPILTNNTAIFASQKHPFHILGPSPLPFLTGLFLFLFLVPLTLYMHGLNLYGIARSDAMHISFLGLYITVMWWFLTILKESRWGFHTRKVQNGLRLGMILFIVSEVMFFFAFFWAFFHYSLVPSIAIGNIWPPFGTQELNVWGLPFVNTLLLLASGVTITIAHAYIVKNNTSGFSFYLFLTILLGVTFLFCQGYEYKYGVKFSWRDNIYGSIFFITTGFHGLHVTIGTLFLLFCWIRHFVTKIVPEMLEQANQTSAHTNKLVFWSFTPRQHFGFEAAAWYWHFVDVVWLFLFITIYWWGGK